MAVAVAIMFAGVIGWTVTRSRSADAPVPRVVADESVPPDIKSRPAVSSNGLPIGAPTGKDFYMEFADKDDPSRRAGVVRAAKGDPGIGGSYLLTSPEFLYFTKDGRLVHFSADKGEAFFPSQERGSRPESGYFEGRVVLRVFEKRIVSEPIDPKRDTPTMVGKTTKLLYDGALGEVHAPEHFEVDGREGSFVGTNVTLIMSEARQQLMWAVVDPGSVLTIKPKSGKNAKASEGLHDVSLVTDEELASTGSNAPGNGAQLVAGDSPASGAASKVPPKEAFYQVTSVGGVRVEQGSRTLESYEALVWVRLLDNRLPPLALGETGPKAPAGAKGGPELASQADDLVIGMNASEPGRVPATGSAGAPRPREDSSAPVRIVFTGALEVKLLDARADELAHDDVLLRFLGGEGRRATFADSKSKADAAGDTIEYAATTQRLALVGSTECPATLGISGSGTATGQRFDVDLREGVASVLGEGALVAKADEKGEPNARTLSWHDGATLGFVVRDGKPASEIEWFKPRGRVVATDRGGTFEGNELDAIFSELPGSAGKRYLSRMVLRNARATDGKGGNIEGDLVTADLAPSGKDANAMPTAISVRGNAAASQGDSSLEAGTIDATLGRDAKGNTIVEHAVATGDARFEGRDGVWANAERIEAFVPGETVDLSGPDVRLGQATTFVKGTQMRLEGGERQRLTVFGAGRFEHVGERDATGAEPRASASWSRQMTFIDTAGELESAGDVVAMWAADELSRDEARADRVKMWFTPGEAGNGMSLTGKRGQDQSPREAAGSGSAGEHTPPAIASLGVADTGAKGRRLVRAEAIGSIEEREDGTRAAVESRRFVAGEGQPKLERLMYVEGGTIKADMRQGTLDVPGAGKLFALDHQRAKDDALEALSKPKADENIATRVANQMGNEIGSGGAKGEAKFEWSGSLHAGPRASGATDAADVGGRIITLHEGVTLRHHRTGDGLLTDLECTDLVATVGSGRGASGDLETATARGSVWLRSGTREITAAELLYDAVRGLVDATAPVGAGTSVTVFDQGSATPMTAKRILWNLSTGRLEVMEPGTIVAPR